MKVNKQLAMLFALYSQAGLPDDRDERLAWCGRELGGRIVRSSKELSAADLTTLTRRLRAIVKSKRSKVLTMPRGREVVMATPEQIWKIEVQLTAYLQWELALTKLWLRKFYKVDGAAALTSEAAVKAIEGLARIAAKKAILFQYGQQHKPTAAQLLDHVTRIKEALKTWRPVEDDVA